LGSCLGACINQELVADYNHRAQEVFDTLAVWKWPFTHKIEIEEHNEQTGDWAKHTFDSWCHLETISSRQAWQCPLFPLGDTYAFDVDKYLILRHYFRTHTTT
jgi:hypothetical protein